MNQLSKAKFYTKLDVVVVFNRVRVREGDEWITAFITRYELFEYLVIPFGLANTPATFQAYINKALQPFLDVFCTAYINNILIYNDTLEEHRDYINLVLEALSAARL